MKAWSCATILCAAGLGAQAILAAEKLESASQNPGPARFSPAVGEPTVALLVDQGAGQTLFERDASKPFLPASITKVMTLLVAFDLIKAGKLAEDQVFTVAPETAQQWSGKGTSLYLKGGMRVTVRDLMLGISTASANDAAEVLAQAAAGPDAARSRANWIGLMNTRARTLGMTASRFATPNGWPDAGATWVSASDLVRLGEALLQDHPDLYRRYVGKPALLWNGATYTNQDPFAGVVAGADGIKTGHTREAGYNFLGSAERDGRRLLVVIGGAPTAAARAAAARELIEWGFADWRSKPLAPAGAIIGQARVQNGTAPSVPLALSRPLSVVGQGDAATRIAARIVYQGPLAAPIKRGTPVASLEIAVDGGKPARLPLLAVRDIEKAGTWRRIVNAIRGLAG